MLSVFWKQVHNFVTWVLDIKVPFPPHCYILGDLCIPKVNRILFLNLIMAAMQLIIAMRKMQACPTRSEWLLKVRLC